MTSDRRWPHPIAATESVSAGVRRLTLRTGLGARPADQRLCEAGNRILGTLEHPNLAHVRAVTRDDESRLVLEYADDGLEPLGPHLGRLDTQRVAHLLQQICAALDAAHGIGVIHGALTPGAIRIESVDAASVRVCDFGLGHLFGANAAVEERVHWLPYSPEKQMGFEPTPAEDVYLVGALGYALVSGRPLFSAPTRAQTLRQHAIEAADDALEALDCDPWLRDVLANCLRKEPEERYASPVALAEALAAGDVDGPGRDAWGSALAAPEPPFDSPALDGAPTVLDAVVSEAESRPTVAIAHEPDRTFARDRRPWLAAAALVVVGIGAWALWPTAQPGETQTRVQPTSAAMAASGSQSESEEARIETPKLAPPLDPPPPDIADAPAPSDAPTKVAAGTDAELLEIEKTLASPVDPGLSKEERLAEAKRLMGEARTARRSGRSQLAINIYQRVLAIRPKHAPAAHALGAIYFNRGKYKTAIEYGKRASAASPRTGSYRLALGDYHYRAGHEAAARKHWKKAEGLGNKLAKKRLASH